MASESLFSTACNRVLQSSPAGTPLGEEPNTSVNSAHREGGRREPTGSSKTEGWEALPRKTDLIRTNQDMTQQGSCKRQGAFLVKANSQPSPVQKIQPAQTRREGREGREGGDGSLNVPNLIHCLEASASFWNFWNYPGVSSIPCKFHESCGLRLEG